MSLWIIYIEAVKCLLESDPIVFSFKEYRDLIALDAKAEEDSYRQKSKKKMLVNKLPMAFNESLFNMTFRTNFNGSIVKKVHRLPPIAFQISTNKVYSCDRSNIIELEVRGSHYTIPLEYIFDILYALSKDSISYGFYACAIATRFGVEQQISICRQLGTQQSII